MTARFLRRLILWYQALTAARPSPCRYWPTCSSYALEALEAHGAAPISQAPGPRAGSKSRTIVRIRRRTRLRTVAPPTCLPMA